MNTIVQLESLGYSFSLDNGKIRYTCTGMSPDSAIVTPLLMELKQCRDEAIQFLQQRVQVSTSESVHNPDLSLSFFDLYDADLVFWFKGLTISQIVAIMMQSYPGDRISIFPVKGVIPLNQ